MKSRMSWSLPLLCLLALAAQAVVVEMDVSSTTQFPVSVVVEPGTTIRFVATDSKPHLIMGISPFFAPTAGPLDSPGPWSGSFEATLGKDTAGQTFYFMEPLNGAGPFGFVVVSSPTDHYIPFTLFNPGTQDFATHYPYNVTIALGERVIWDSSEESLITHSVLLADDKYRPRFVEGVLEPIPMSRNSPRFPLTFAKPGVYPFVCGFHSDMFGTVTVCDAKGLNCPDKYVSDEPACTTPEEEEGQGTVINFNFAGMISRE